MLDRKNKRGQMEAGLVTGLIFGISGLVIGTIIALVVVSSITGAGLLDSARGTINVVNETGWLNDSGYTLTNYSTDYAVLSSFTISLIVNATDATEIIPSANYSITDGVVSNITTLGYPNGFSSANITYSYKIKSRQERSSDAMSANLTGGIGNVSSKLPTVLLVAAIVLILGILSVLIAIWQKMRLSGGGSI